MDDNQQADDDERAIAAHAVLSSMDAEVRIAALATAILDADPDAFSQVFGLAGMTAILARRLDLEQRELIAHRMVDLAVRLVCRWH
jgi:hypothetical protein